VRTRWTLQLTMVAIPWAPTAYFSGVSDYDIDESTGKVRGQQVGEGCIQSNVL
jgi:hypothetical protein